MKRILFIGHEAERTGAPIVLLHLLRWIKKNRPELDVEMLLLRDGDLRPSYEDVATVNVVPQTPLPEIVVRGWRFLRRRLGLKSKLKLADIPPIRREFDLVVGNTVGSLEYLEFFKARGFRTICWLHEMRSIIESFFPESDRFAELAKSVDLFIVASKAVEAVLREFGATNKTEIVYEFSELEPVDAVDSAAVRRSLGIPVDAFVVGGSGTVSSRKGTDLFIEIAARLTSSLEDIYFIWVGGAAGYSAVEFEHAVREISRLQLKRVFLTGARETPGNYFANLDVFALTSREDPFPLVCLEAASLKKPVICFEGAGGMPEFVADDAGSIVPLGDVEAFADAILEYYRDPRKRASAGDAAYRKVNSEFSLDSSCRKITDLILQLCD
ncbi:MAG: glycosyltransferase family 4 protein [Acidobacteriota bacterium]